LIELLLAPQVLTIYPSSFLILLTSTFSTTTTSSAFFLAASYLVFSAASKSFSAYDLSPADLSDLVLEDFSSPVSLIADPVVLASSSVFPTSAFSTKF